MSDYILRSNNYDKEVRQKSVDNDCNQYQDNKRLYQHNGSERHDFQLNNNSQTAMAEIGNSFFGELEKMLSTQIQILNMARQNALKVKGSCGVPQRPHNEAKAKYTAANTTENQHLMSGVPQSSVIDNLEYFGNIIEQNNNIPMDMLCLENTSHFNCPPNVHASQPVQQCATPPQMRGSCGTFPSQFMQAKQNNVLKRKAAHNQIEKRRRSFINDKIAELQSLLPEDVNRTSCTNKGAILKESVDYIKKLQSDFSVITQLKERINEIDLESKQLAMRLELLEIRTTTTSASTKNPDTDENRSSKLEERVNLSFDTVMTDCLPKVLPTVSETMDFEDVLDSIASTFKEC